MTQPVGHSRRKRAHAWAGWMLTAPQAQVMRVIVSRLRDDGEAIPCTEIEDEVGYLGVAAILRALSFKGLVGLAKETSWGGGALALVVRGVLDEFGDWYEPTIRAPNEPSEAA